MRWVVATLSLLIASSAVALPVQAGPVRDLIQALPDLEEQAPAPDDPALLLWQIVAAILGEGADEAPWNAIQMVQAYLESLGEYAKDANDCLPYISTDSGDPSQLVPWVDAEQDPSDPEVVVLTVLTSVQRLVASVDTGCLTAGIPTPSQQQSAPDP